MSIEIHVEISHLRLEKSRIVLIYWSIDSIDDIDQYWYIDENNIELQDFYIEDRVLS